MNQAPQKILQFESIDFQNMEKQYRTHLINCLSGAKSANLIGTIDQQGRENLSIVSSVVHIGADPALIAMVMRPHTVPRDTFENIQQTGFWTVNHVNSEIFHRAHQTSARYPKGVSEFTEVGLTPEYLNTFKAPYVTESNLKFGVELKEIIHLKINGTELVIGEIKHLIIPEKVLGKDGFIDLNLAGTVAVTGLDAYHELSALDRLPYAKAPRTDLIKP